MDVPPGRHRTGPGSAGVRAAHVGVRGRERHGAGPGRAHVVDALAGEVQRSLDFYTATTSHGEVERIFMTGGTAKIPYLRAAIEKRSRVQVEALDPFRRVLFDQRQFNPDVLKSQAPQATVCLGLALRKQKERI